MIPNEEKEGARYISVKKKICITMRNNFKNDGDFYCLNCL